MGERPRQSFLSWTLKVVGLWLNLYVGFVSAPESLGGWLPRPLAYGLPAFVVLLIFAWAAPLKPDGFDTKKIPRWQWLLWAAVFAAFWGWAAPWDVK